jgi:L-amino acid N-acyltransferase YncA
MSAIVPPQISNSQNYYLATNQLIRNEITGFMQRWRGNFGLGFCNRCSAGVIEFRAMSTATMRPELQIRPAREGDAAPMCEIYNEAVQDYLETFNSDPRAVDEQRLLIATAEQLPKQPILVADVRNWIAGWVALAPYDTRITLGDIGEVLIYVRRTFRSYGVGRQLMRAIQEAAGKLGYRKLIGRVLVENRDGLLLCHATGWREVGRHLGHARLKNGLHDVMLVEYVIPASPVPHT